MKKLRRDDTVEFRLWANDTLVADERWEVFTSTEDPDALYAMLYPKDTGGVTYKVRIAKKTYAPMEEQTPTATDTERPTDEPST